MALLRPGSASQEAGAYTLSPAQREPTVPKQKSKTSLEQLATVVAATRDELQSRGIGFLVIRPSDEAPQGRRVDTLGPHAKATNAVLPPKLQRLIDAVLKSRGSDPAHEFLVDVQARITHLNLSPTPPAGSE